MSACSFGLRKINLQPGKKHDQQLADFSEKGQDRHALSRQVQARGTHDHSNQQQADHAWQFDSRTQRRDEQEERKGYGNDAEEGQMCQRLKELFQHSSIRVGSLREGTYRSKMVTITTNNI